MLISDLVSFPDSISVTSDVIESCVATVSCPAALITSLTPNDISGTCPL